MSDTKSPRGSNSHKNPYCACLPCTARRRKEEALTGTAGDGGPAVESQDKIIQQDEVLEGDAPLIPATFRSRVNPRDRIIEWLSLKTQNPTVTHAEAARKMGISRSYLSSLISKAVKSGWLRFDDPVSRLEHEIIPKTLDNIAEFLNQKDKTVTIRTAEGTIFKAYQESKGIVETPRTLLAIKIETPPTDTKITVGGNIFGKPRDIIDVTPEEV